MKQLYVQGETKYCSLLIESTHSKPFLIREASWELFRGAELESSGVSEIQDNVIRSLISPKTKYKSYQLIVSYAIANQSLKSIVEVEST